MAEPRAPSPWDEYDPLPRAAPAPARAEAAGVAGVRLYSVAEISRAIRQELEGFGRVAVEGEVSRIVRAASGHLYFDLKDADAKISCTIWRSQVAAAIRFDLREGRRVIAHGKLDVYAPRGTYSLNVARLEERGVGALLVELEARKAELRARGWFDRHRPIPSLPRVIGVVTSRDGAAFQDILRTRTLRWPLYPLRLAHTPVQGALAAREIAAAIARLDASGVDVIVVARGGGSIEDLWAFNELAVVEAIRAASVPVVAGVGHETDVTLADLVADHRAHTPTDAAQTVIPDRAALEAEVLRLEVWLGRAVDGVLCEREERLERVARSRTLRDAEWMLVDRLAALDHHLRCLRLATSARLSGAAARLDAASVRLARHHPAVRIEQGDARLASLAPRLAATVERPLAERTGRLALAGSTLEAISPFAVLARGYSITRRRGGNGALTSAAGVQPGEELETRLADGTLISRVEAAAPDAPRAPGAKARP